MAGRSQELVRVGVGRAKRVHPLLLAALVLEPDLDDAHGEAGVAGQLLAHQPRWLRGLCEDVLQHLQLLGRDVGAGSTSLAVLALFIIFFFFLR